jgi:hypothetical protein
MWTSVCPCTEAPGTAARHFVQSFVLAPQENGFYVLNDIIRFVVGWCRLTVSNPAMKAPMASALEATMW